MDPQTPYPVKDDHDIMVSLVTEFNLTIKNVKEKIEEDHTTTLEVKELLEQNYQKLSDRIANVEDAILKLDPERVAKLASDVMELKQWQRDFDTKKHIAWVVAAAGFALVGYYLPFFINSMINIIKNLSVLK